MRRFVFLVLSLAEASVSQTAAGSALEHEEHAALEQRIAELEAASLRAGDRKLTMHIYGQVNQAIMFWDDGFKSGMRVIDNDTSSSRFGIMGRTTSRSAPTVGYRIEFEIDPLSRHSGSGATSISDSPAHLRHAYVYVEDDRAGRLSLGHQSPATDDITIINLGSQMNDAALHYNTNSAIPLAIGGGLVTDLRWGDIAHNVDSLRGNLVRYDTPMLAGFVLSGAWGENDIWDVALRYQASAVGFRFAAGAGFMDDRERDFKDVRGSASLIHNETGLYVSVAGGIRDDDVSVLSAHDTAFFHYGQVGISKQWLPYGRTTIFADYGLYKNFNVGELLRVDPHTGALVIWGTLSQTEVVRWGAGIEQAFDDTGLLLYAQAHRYEATIIGFPCDANPGNFPNNCGGDPSNLVELPTEPWVAFITGARIKF
ncbi:MAG: porin [Hyphomicrobiaceae bacterium]